MAKVAFMFPGQGSQRVGMGKQLCDQYPEVKTAFFDRADEVLGFGLSQLCFEGPEEELVKTENQQPAIFLVSAATRAVLGQRGVSAEGVAGHSLGEYSALVAAGAFDFETGLRLTRRRGQMMADIASRTGGIMAAILGLPAEQVQEICREAAAGGGVAEVANFNSPTQTVISGEEQPIKAAMELAKERGAERVVQLNVSAPFHCSLMAPLAEAFQPVLGQETIRDSQIPVMANVTANWERTSDEIRNNLVEQLDSSVRWTDSMQRMIDDGFDTFIEVGPGRVLTGLMRAINPDIAVFNTNNPGSLEQAVTGAG